MAQYLVRLDNGQHVIFDELEFGLSNLAVGDGLRNPFIRLEGGDESVTCLVVDKYLYERYRHDESEESVTVIKQALAVVDCDISQKSDADLVKFLDEKVRTTGRFYGSELSDDSDQEDERALSAESDKFKIISDAQKTTNFWLRTKRQSRMSGNISSKLVELRRKIERRRIVNEDTIASELQKIGKVTFHDKFQISELPYEDVTRAKLTSDDKKAIEDVNGLLKGCRLVDEDEKKTAEEKVRQVLGGRKFYVIHYRGINYLQSRWNASSRRYHCKMTEVARPQYCEMVLKSLQFDFYRELSSGNDYSETEALRRRLEIRSDEVGRFLGDLRDGYRYCVNFADPQAETRPYLFNNVLECLQHKYSSSTKHFLKKLKGLRETHPGFWHQFPASSSWNPFLSTSNCTYHAAKYAHSMKPFYADENPPKPRWHRDGRLEYRHFGKVYVSLHPVAEMLLDNQPNNNLQLAREGRIPLRREVEMEKETTFLGSIPAERIFFHMTAKYPDFSRRHSPIHELKYGLNEKLYELFKYFIAKSVPNTAYRESVAGLLSEWLCVYQSVLLSRIATLRANEEGAKLVFIGSDGHLTEEPPKYTLRSGSKNEGTRNEIHRHRDIRSHIGSLLTEERNVHPTDPESGFQVTDVENVIGTLFDLPDAVLEKDEAKNYTDTQYAEIRNKLRETLMLPPHVYGTAELCAVDEVLTG